MACVTPPQVGSRKGDNGKGGDTIQDCGKAKDIKQRYATLAIKRKKKKSIILHIQRLTGGGTNLLVSKQIILTCQNTENRDIITNWTV